MTLIKIAVGDSRKCTKWQNKTMTWAELVKRLHNPTRTSETAEEYKRMAKAKRDDIKDVGGYVGGVLKGGRRKATSIVERYLITLDFDEIKEGDDPWGMFAVLYGNASAMYTTHSHADDNPRYRIVIPLSRAVTPDEYVAVARRISGDIGIDSADDTTYEPHRLMYWPSHAYDAPYQVEQLKGPTLSPDEVLRRYTDWRDPSEWPTSSRQAVIMERVAKKQGEPTEKPGVIGAFNRCYNVHEAIATFLPSVYEPYAEDRYSYKEGSTVGGLTIYEGGKFAYSHHGTDPATGQLLSAYDLVRLHLYGDQDGDEDTPINKRPSSVLMRDMSLDLADVKSDLLRHRLDAVTESLAEDYEEVSSDPEEMADWIGSLTVTKSGAIAPTIDNVLTVLEHDPRLASAYQYDAFRLRPEVIGDLPWAKYDIRDSSVWSDVDDAGLRHHLERYYEIASPNKIRDAVDLAMERRKVHPVKAYLGALEWDGVERMDRLFIDFLGAEDTTYTRAATRRSLIGAVARIYDPGCKHDHVLVLVGAQGCGKSTILSRLGGEWYTDSVYTVTGKEAYEQIQGVWIVEMAEMSATRKAENEQIKQFISKQVDSFRAAYARRVQDHPRQCAFFGSTNDAEFLKDATGARRYWPINVRDVGRDLWTELTDELIGLIWAEAVEAYKRGERWHLSKAEEAQAQIAQAEHTEIDGKRGLIEQFIHTPVPEGWDALTLEARQLWHARQLPPDGEVLVPRDKICALEIWVELLGSDPRYYTKQTARELNDILRSIPNLEPKSSLRCGIYGTQRGFLVRDL